MHTRISLNAGALHAKKWLDCWISRFDRVATDGNICAGAKCADTGV